MDALVSAVVAWAHRRRPLVIGGVLCAVLVSLEGARRLSFDSDVLSLLPHDNRVIQSFREFLARFGSLDQLYVVFTAPEGHAISEYHDEVGAWVDRLRAAPEITRVDAGVVDRTRDFGWLADRQLLVLGDGPLDEALRRLQPEGMIAAVTARRELLTLPSPEIAELVRQDPAGLYDLVRDAFGGAQAGLGTRIGADGYVTRDGHSRLVIARPQRPPYDAAFSRALDARLRDIHASAAGRAAQEPASAGSDEEPRPSLRVEFAGGHRIAVETEAVVRRESIMNTIGSLALILPLLLLAFRSVWLVAVGSLPSGLSLVIVLGALGFAGARVSAAATGAAAMLFGLGVDGVVLLYVAHRLALAEDATAGVPAAIAGPSSSMLLGMWTTAATFYGLMFVDFPSLQQLGRLLGHSMVICGILTLVMVPALLPRRPPRRRGAALLMPGLAGWIARRHRAVLVTSVALTCVLGACALRLRINPTLDRLRSVTGAAQLETRIASAFGLPSDVYVVLAQGPDLEPLLETNERLARRLSAEIPQLAFQPPTRLLPPAATQARAVAHMGEARVSPASVRAALHQARIAGGFTAGAFEPFSARLPRLLDPAARLTYDGYISHGLDDLIDRFIVHHYDVHHHDVHEHDVHEHDRWTLATYVFPTSVDQTSRVQAVVDHVDPTQTLTGLTLVNRELANLFLPQFIKGLSIGTSIVVVLVVAAFRSWRLSAFAMLPTFAGLIWTAGALALAGVELDLFAVFAVVTFVGIGVDYGVHLVHRWQERGDAVRATAELAPVILAAAAITMLGYGTLVTSSYPPLRSMGVVSAVSVVALAAASVLFLPALLLAEQRRPISSQNARASLAAAAADVATDRGDGTRVDVDRVRDVRLQPDRPGRLWTRHGLNSGAIFSATCRGVALLPRAVSYAIGDAGTWLAWRLMGDTRAAVADNLRALFPDEPDAALRRRALGTFRAYARDVIDFLRALRAPQRELQALFAWEPEDARLFDRLLSQGRGIILVSGHYGNWEAGGVFLRRVCDLPLTILAMTEAGPEANRLRQDIRARLGADTIEVRRSLDTALQIRRRLADNRIVAMLMDRHVDRDRIQVDLVGRRAWFLKTPALMGFLTGAPVLPCFIERAAPARFAVRAGVPIVVSTDLPRDEAIQRASQQFADQLGARIRTHPQFWYHFYRYWEDQADTAERA